MRECNYYRLLPSSNLFQWKYGNNIVFSYSLPINTTNVNPIKSLCSPIECNEQCKLDENCLYTISTFDGGNGRDPDKKDICSRFDAIIDENYVISYYKEVAEKLNIPLFSQINNTFSQENQNINDVEATDPYYKDENPYNISSTLLYGLTIIVLVLVAIILFICKRRSDNEKMLLYTISNMTGNSQSRSRSKSSPSECLSYNNTNLSGSIFQNNFNGSSITINPDNFDNSKYGKSSNNRSSSNLKKSYRKSASSRAPSVHSISTLCTTTSNNNTINLLSNNSSINGQVDSSINDKSVHIPPLTTKKNSTYNYSIKTLSTKDPSLTGLSQNIKTLFANSYSGDNSSIHENFGYSTSNNHSSYSGKSTKDFPYEKLINKDSGGISNSNVKNKYNQHKKQSSSISINIPKVASSSSISISPKNTKNITSPQQPKIVKLKKPVHTKQISISRSVYSEPIVPFNKTTNSEISIKNDDLENIGNLYIDSQEPITINTKINNNNNSSIFKYN
jgi:hypothetical protein